MMPTLSQPNRCRNSKPRRERIAIDMIPRPITAQVAQGRLAHARFLRRDEDLVDALDQ
jgi:hypothetical protein